MATVAAFMPRPQPYYMELQERTNIAEGRRHERFMADLLLQRFARGFLVRKHLKWLAQNAIILQCAYRCHHARKTVYRMYLRRAVKNKHGTYYALSATKIQALWNGFMSRRKRFCYRAYRRWLATVSERGERRAAEAAEFRVRSRADDLRILEEEARQWLAFVVFKLHHLLRTYVCPGVYSEQSSAQLSEFEELLVSIRYTEYMKRLRRKYVEFVRKHRPKYCNKRLFPIIGDGADYWYLSLSEMYKLTETVKLPRQTRHLMLHHGPQHKKPFLWKNLHVEEGKGPFLEVPETPRRARPRVLPFTPAPTPAPSGDTGRTMRRPRFADPRFHLYVQHYTPQPDLFEYVDYHINTLLARKCSIKNMEVV